MLTLILTLALVQEPITLHRVVQPGSIVQPTDLVSIPGDDRVFVTERTGRAKIVRDGIVSPTPFLDVSARVDANGEVGLRSLAFHPDHASNGFVYVWYDAPNGTPGVDGVLARFVLDPANPDRVDPTTFAELLRVPQDGRSHGGGALRFGPDGMLYLAIGDGQPGGDPNCRAQDLSNLLGSMIRIDVDGGVPYAIPPDNPYVGVSGARGEIVHHGLRHPWKWSFDPATGDQWIADVGELQREEIDLVPAGTFGLNFGWSSIEGTVCGTVAPCPGYPPCTSPTFTAPIHEYDHSLGCSVTGGVVYRGTLIPDLFGAYLFTDFCSARIWTLRVAGGQVTELVQRMKATYPGNASLTLPVAVGTDGDGEILIADYVDGEIYRVLRHCILRPLCQGERNSVGTRGRLGATGTVSLTQRDLVFELSSAPPMTFAILFYGQGVVSAPAGNGTLCVGPGSSILVRASLAQADATGTAVFPADIGQPPFTAGPGRIDPGSTWHFQSWYRDVGGPLGATFNLSGALSVVFCP